MCIKLTKGAMQGPLADIGRHGDLKIKIIGIRGDPDSSDKSAARDAMLFINKCLFW